MKAKAETKKAGPYHEASLQSKSSTAQKIDPINHPVKWESAAELFSTNQLLLNQKKIQFTTKGAELIAATLPWHWHTIRCELATMQFGEVVRLLEGKHHE